MESLKNLKAPPATKLGKMNSGELKKELHILDAQKKAFLDQYKMEASKIQDVLTVRLQQEQIARRSANPEQYDKLHQGIGINVNPIKNKKK